MSDEQQSKYEEITETIVRRLQKERTKRQFSTLTLLGLLAAIVVAFPILMGGGRTFFRCVDCPDRLDAVAAEVQQFKDEDAKYENSMSWKMYRVERRLSIQDDPPRQQQEQIEMRGRPATNEVALVDTNHLASLP